MPRQCRIDYPGAVHHVIIRGINKARIFHNDGDRKEFLLRFQAGLKKTGVICYAWALIPNHAHLVLKTGPQPLTKLMSSLLTGYALYFNKQHDRVGYLFQNRYKSILCDREAYLLQLIRYIHLNPLRAKLVENFSQLSSFPWCGHSVLMGRRTDEWQETGEILSRFGSTLKKARIRYLDFVRKGLGEGKRTDLTGGGLIRSAGGWQNVLDLRKSGERWRGDERILGDSNFILRALKKAEERLTRKEQKKIGGWDLPYLLTYVSGVCEVKENDIRGKRRIHSFSQARAVFSWWATSELGFSLTEISDFLQRTPAAILYLSKKGEELIREKKLIFPSSQEEQVT